MVCVYRVKEESGKASLNDLMGVSRTAQIASSDRLVPNLLVDLIINNVINIVIDLHKKSV